MLNFFAKKFFGSSNDRLLKTIYPLVEKTNKLEKNKKISDDGLIKKSNEFRDLIKKGRNPEELIPEVFANVREAAKRSLGQRHYDVQIIGGIVLS